MHRWRWQAAGVMLLLLLAFFPPEARHPLLCSSCDVMCAWSIPRFDKITGHTLGSKTPEAPCVCLRFSTPYIPIPQ